jgi:hypothetical protein
MKFDRPAAAGVAALLALSWFLVSDQVVVVGESTFAVLALEDLDGSGMVLGKMQTEADVGNVNFRALSAFVLVDLVVSLINRRVFVAHFCHVSKLVGFALQLLATIAESFIAVCYQSFSIGEILRAVPAFGDILLSFLLLFHFHVFLLLLDAQRALADVALGQRFAHELTVAAETGVLLPVRLQLLLAVEVHGAVLALLVADALVQLELLDAGEVDFALAAHLRLRVLPQSGLECERGFAVHALEGQFLDRFGLFFRAVLGRVAVFNVQQQDGAAAEVQQALEAVVALLALVRLQLGGRVKAHGAVGAAVGAVREVLGLQRFLLLETQSHRFAHVFAHWAEIEVFLVARGAGAGFLVLPQEVVAVEVDHANAALGALRMSRFVGGVDFSAKLADREVGWWGWGLLCRFAGCARLFFTTAAGARQRRVSRVECLG